MEETRTLISKFSSPTISEGVQHWSYQRSAKEYSKGLNQHMTHASHQVTNTHNMATAFLKDRKGGGKKTKTPLTILAFFPLFLSCWTAKACSTLSMETPLTIATRSFSLKRQVVKTESQRTASQEDPSLYTQRKENNLVKSRGWWEPMFLCSSVHFDFCIIFFLACGFSQAQGEEMMKFFPFPFPIIMVSTVVVKLRATCEPITPTVVKTEGMWFL